MSGHIRDTPLFKAHGVSLAVNRLHRDSGTPENHNEFLRIRVLCDELVQSLKDKENNEYR